LKRVTLHRWFSKAAPINGSTQAISGETQPILLSLQSPRKRAFRRPESAQDPFGFTSKTSKAIRSNAVGGLITRKMHHTASKSAGVPRQG